MRAVCCLLVTACLISSATAIYEEQAGVYDWHREHIGRVTHAEFAFRGVGRVFVATNAAVLASLDTRDGSTSWRQVLEEGHAIDALALSPRPASVLTLSKQGRFLRAWNALDGTLLWERVVADSPVESKLLTVLPDVTGDGSSDVAVLLDGKLQVFSTPTGKLAWSVALSPGGNWTALTATSTDENPEILAAKLSSSGKAVEVARVAKDGTVISSESASVSPRLSLLAFGATRLAALSADGAQLCTFNIAGSLASKCLSLSALVPAAGSATAIGVESAGGDTLAIKYSKGVALVDLAAALPSAIFSAEAGAVATGVEGAAGLVSLTTKGNLKTQLVSLASQQVLDTVDHASKGKSIFINDAGTPLGISYAKMASRKITDPSRGEGTAYRFLVVTEDDSLSFLESGQIVWRREEALAQVVSTLFVDLPAPTIELEAEIRAAKPTLADRVNAEVLTLKKQFGILKPEEDIQLRDLNARMSTRLLPYRDSNGFRKLVVVLTASGKLLGLHSGDGRVLWELSLSSEVPLTRLALWRSSHDTTHAPEVLVLGSKTNSTVYKVVDAHAGRVISSGKVQEAVSKVIELPQHLHDGTAEQHVFALVSGPPDAPTVSTLPDTFEAKELASSEPLYFWDADLTAGTMHGFMGKPGGAAEQLWSTAFLPPKNTILAIAARDPEEHIYSYAKILGDRSLKLKYINPNLAFVVSGVPNGVSSSDLGEVSLTVQLIDTVSGQVIFRMLHEGARGPATAVLSEHWAVYSYYSTLNQRFEISVLEFYDATARDLNIPSLLFGSQNTTLSSYAPTPIEVLHQSYFTAVPLKTMAVTSTRRGITSKQLLLGTLSNQVYLMDKRFVDPRRPKGTPTADEKAEMLPPYAEELPFTATLFATHKKAVENLRGITTSPANLESTTLALAYGLDLFLFRVQPSKTFDLLPDDFPYALLITVTVALTVAAVVLKRMEDASAVKRKWD